MKKLILVASIALALTACGSGGGGGEPAAAPAAATQAPVAAAPVTTLPFAVAYRNMIMSASNDLYHVSGTCTGNWRLIQDVPVSAIYKGFSGYIKKARVTASFNGPCPSMDFDAASFYDDQYRLLATEVLNGEYDYFYNAQLPLPVNVSIGDSGVISQLNSYADNTMNIKTGKVITEWKAFAGNANSIVIAIKANRYNNNNLLTLSSDARYRLADNQTMVQISDDVYAKGVHFVLTHY